MFNRNKNGNAPTETRRVRKLRADLDEAKDLHELTGNPLRNAVALERARVMTSRWMWRFLALGLAFTTTGVQDFLAGDRSSDDPVWWGCWLVEPALAGILITLLVWESEMLNRHVPIPDGPVKWLKRVLLGSTLMMNVYPTLFPRVGAGPVSPGMVFVHVVIPTVVFLVAEVMPIIQATFAEAIRRAAPPAPTPEPAAAREPASVAAPVPAPARPVPATAAVGALPAVKLALPPTLLAKLDATRAELGRDLTAADIRDALKVNDAYAAQLAASLTTPATNGHTIL